VGRRERRGMLSYGDCVLTDDCVREIGMRVGRREREGERYVTWIVC